MWRKFLNKISSLFNSKVENLLCSINENLLTIINGKKNEKIYCDYEDCDELKLYSGCDVVINDYITVHIPLLSEIRDYGEKAYYNMVYTLCSVGADLKWQLDDIGIDYSQIDDYELFYSVLSKGFKKENTSILFGDVIDFSKMQIMYNTNIEENVLIQAIDEDEYIQIDKYVYTAIVNTLRKIHRIKRNDEKAMNETTRRILIDDARDEYEENKGKPSKPFLQPLVSAMVNSSGFKKDNITVFDMNIYAFMDSVARIGKIKNAELLLQSGYSGFGIDLKKLNNEETNWLGELK